jgi:hypothetical protein
MQIQEATIESPEAEQVPEIPSPSADDQKSPEAKGRYGWVALLAVAAIAVGLLVVQVIASPEPSFELDASYAVAEQNRFDALAGSSVSDELDPSYAKAEQNRFDALSESSGSDELDPSYAKAEQNRFDALSESSGSDELDPSYAKAEQNRFDALTE